MAVHFAVRLTPRSGRDDVIGAGPDGALRVRVAAPPVDGEANRALISLLAGRLGVPASAVVVESGATSRTKRLVVDGVDGARVGALWPGTAVREDH